MVLFRSDVTVVLPGGHDSQLSDPSTKFVRPASQAEQSGAPAWLKRATAQSSHRVDPAAAARVPASQDSQLLAPVTLPNFPLSHGKQYDWPVPPWYLPASHGVQLVALPLAVYLPVAQASQLPLPVPLWKRPFSQALHDDAALPLHLPAEQSLHLCDAPALNDPALQAVQVDEPLATPV